MMLKKLGLLDDLIREFSEIALLQPITNQQCANRVDAAPQAHACEVPSRYCQDSPPPTEADFVQADLHYNNLKNSGELQRRRDAENFDRQVQQNLSDYYEPRKTTT